MSRYFTQKRREEMKHEPPVPPIIIPEPEPEHEKSFSLDLPKRGPGHPCEGEEVSTPQLVKYVLHRVLIEQAGIRELARECSVSPSTIEYILDKHNIQRVMKTTKARIVGAIPKAAEVVIAAIEANDPEISYRLLKDTGAMNVDPSNAGGQPGGITINLGFLNAARKEAIRVAQSPSSPDSEPIDVVAEVHTDKG